MGLQNSVQLHPLIGKHTQYGIMTGQPLGISKHRTENPERTNTHNRHIYHQNVFRAERRLGDQEPRGKEQQDGTTCSTCPQCNNSGKSPAVLYHIRRNPAALHTPVSGRFYLLMFSFHVIPPPSGPESSGNRRPVLQATLHVFLSRQPSRRPSR